MGRFVYARRTAAEFDDRLLAHLQAAIGVKLRRGEGFYFSWQEDHGSGEYTAVWIHPSTTMAYLYSDDAEHPLNDSWLDALLLAADSEDGLHPLPEPEPEGGFGAPRPST